MRVLVFLDFDGVLHPISGKRTFVEESIASLAEAFVGYRVEVVVASSWREERTLDQLRDLLRGLRCPVVGITPVIDEPFLKDVRYHEVMAYLQREGQASPWLAIDDTPGFYPAAAPVFWTNPYKGFTREDIQRLRELLAAITN